MIWLPLAISAAVVTALVWRAVSFHEPGELGAEARPDNEQFLLRDKRLQITPHFNSSEFCSRVWPSPDFRIDRRLVDKLQALRNLVGRSIHINSGYRSPNHNAAVGGVKNSYHMYGMAADINIPGYTVYQIRQMARNVGFGGIGVYPSQNFVHLDIGPRREWSG